MKTPLIALIVFLVTYSFAHAQEDEYFKTSERKGLPLLLKQVAPYEKVVSKFDYFDLSEESYNTIFYQGLVVENSPNGGGFRRFDAILLKKLIIEPKAFPDYQFVLNPKLEKGYYSKHRVSINIRKESITSNFQTKDIEIIFPESILLAKDNTRAKMRINSRKGLTHYNEGTINSYHGISINDIQGFSMDHSFIPNSFVELTAFDNAQLKFQNNEAYEFPNLIFENNQLANFINSYKQTNKVQKLKAPNEYKSAILLKDVEGITQFDSPLKCKITEIYFFENVVAGVIDFPSNSKKKLLKDLNKINNVVNRSDFKLKDNGDFPTIYDTCKNTYYKIEQDFNSVKIYFITVR